MLSNQKWGPISYLLARLRGGSALDVSALASDERVIAPATETETAAAIYDPADLERIKAVQEDTTWERERERITARRTFHAATRLFKLDNALIQGSFLYAGSQRMPIADPSWLELKPWRTASVLPTGLLCSSLYTSRFFSHWFTDHLTAELLGRELGLPTYASARQKSYTHEPGVRQALDLRTAAAIESGFFESLWIGHDIGQNTSKRLRYVQLRERLRAGARPIACPGVMILRGDSGARRVLVNEALLAEQLASLGFQILDPQRDSFETMRDALSEAPLVLGVEGSALVHAIMMMPSRGCLAVIQPPRRFNNLQKNYTDCIGQRYAFTVADEIDGGFHLPSARMLGLIERIARESPSTSRSMAEVRS